MFWTSAYDNCMRRVSIKDLRDEKSCTLMTTSAVKALAHFIHEALPVGLEAIRPARAGYVLLRCGCSGDAPFPGTDLASHLISAQHEDGGWSDVEETLWCLGYLTLLGNRYEAEVTTGMNWLSSVRWPCGSWGRSDRDLPRIPITALASVLVPGAVDRHGLEWLASQWEADLASPTQLTYKGAFFLLSQAHDQAPTATDLVERTIDYLRREQDNDGGFGPWKGHPVGSDPWTTGLVLWGLSGFSRRTPSEAFKRAMHWLQSKQLPNGLWPYHYLDDGTSMALIGLSSILPLSGEY